MTTAVVVDGRLQTERLPNGRRKLLRPFRVDLGVNLMLGRGIYKGFDLTPRGKFRHERYTVVTVPGGFETDFSSIPGFARTMMGRFDRHDIAGVLHDWCYKVGVPYGVSNRVWRIVARSGERRLGPVRAALGWLGLTLGGWVAYRRHAKERGD